MKKITSVIVASFVAVNAFFIAGVSILSYIKYTNFSFDEISQTHLASINEKMNEVSALVTSVSDAAIYIVTNRSVLQALSRSRITDYDAIVEQRELSKLMNDIASLNQSIHSIELYTDRYELFPKLKEGRIYPIEGLESQRWFKPLADMDNGWVPKHQSVNGEQEFVSYIHSLLNLHGKTVGYVKVNVLIDTVEQLLSDRDGLLLVLDSGDRIILQKNVEPYAEVLDEVARDATLKQTYAEMFNTYQTVEKDGKQYLLILSERSSKHWRLAYLISSDFLYTETKRIGLFVMALGGMSLLLSIPVVYFVGKKIFKPIDDIMGGLKEIEKGNFLFRTKPHFIEEFKLISENFNKMAAQLDQTLKELERKNRAKREAEIKTLQHQIAPHFLYNTLDAIHWKALDYKAEDISYMVSQLSKMFRISLSGGDMFIPLRDEMEHARSYMNIQRARLGVNVTYSENVPAEIKDFYVPKIMLQPFIENSFKHGFPDRSNQIAKITVEAKVKAEDLVINIVDNGIGLQSGWDQKESKGIGIQNVQERIKLYCGPAYGVTLCNRSQGGTAVHIRLPIVQNIKEKIPSDERKKPL